MTHGREERVLHDASSPAEAVAALGRLRIPPGTLWDRLPWLGIVAGVVGGLAAWAAAGDARQLAFSWLVAILFFVSIALGSLFFVLVHWAANAGWGVVVRRIAENQAATIPILALLALPALFDVHALYEWSHPEAVAGDAILESKAPWLDPSFFRIRAVVYFLAWSAIAWYFARASWAQDATSDHAPSRRAFRAAGPALAIFAITVTFAAFDWIMSLEPHWYSTILGVYFFAGCLVGAFATTAIVAASLDRPGYLGGAVQVEHFHDVGKLLFAFTVFWAYIALSQFLLIWYGNLPEETVWYLRRTETGWRGLTVFLAIGHFAVPFFFLMSRHVKRRRGLLVAGATWMLLMHLLDLHWLVMPTLHREGPAPGLVDAAALLGVGGAFCAALGWLMRRQALIPKGDPRLVESLQQDHG